MPHVAAKVNRSHEQDYMGRGPKEVRAHLIETARPVMEAMVQEIPGVTAVTMHHDVSTVTGEEVVLFTLAEPPGLREAKKR